MVNRFLHIIFGVAFLQRLCFYGYHLLHHVIIIAKRAGLVNLFLGFFWAFLVL
jgi:hypothetical protein